VQQRDYIERMIQQIAAIIAAVLGKVARGRLARRDHVSRKATEAPGGAG
jgi:hypothetical protein